MLSNVPDESAPCAGDETDDGASMLAFGDRRRRARASLPTRNVQETSSNGGSSSCAVSQEGLVDADADDAIERERHEQHEQQQQVATLKRRWGELLDRVDEQLTQGKTRVRPTGSRGHDDIMQLWGKLTWPAVYLSHAAHRELSNDEVEMLARMAPIAAQAERDLNSELRISISISGSYDNLVQTLTEPTTATDAHPALAYRQAMTGLASAIQTLHVDYGVDLGGDLRDALMSIPIVAHLTLHDGDDAFSQSETPAELVFVTLSEHPAPGVVDGVCVECCATLTNGDESTSPTFNLSRGVVFSDATAGIACVAMSTLTELGAEVQTREAATLLKLHPDTAELFFEHAFDGSQGGHLGDGDLRGPPIVGGTETVYNYLSW